MGDHTQKPKLNWPNSTTARKWIYGVGVALAPVFVAYGIVEADKVPLWVSLLGAIVGIGNIVALGNVNNAE